MDNNGDETLMEVQHSQLFKLKRKILFMAVFMFYLLCGLEYSITIPSALLYGKYSDEDRTYMLTEVGLYPLAAMLTSLFFGHYYDRTKRIRSILLGQCVVQVIGNFVYAIHYERWLSLLGRFVSGLGDGYIAVSIAEVTYLYEDNDRIGMVCLLELGRVIGFMNGPVINYFITKWSDAHQWTIEKKTLPGYTMGCAWSVLTLVSFCCVHNLALEIIEKLNLNDTPFLRAKTRIYNEEENRYENIEEVTKMLPDDDDSNPIDDSDEFGEEEQQTDLFEPELEADGEIVNDNEPSIHFTPPAPKLPVTKMLPDEDNSNPFDDSDEFSEEEKQADIFAPKSEADSDTRESPAHSSPLAPGLPVKEPKPKIPLKERIRSSFLFKYHAVKEKISHDNNEMLHKFYVSQIFHPEIALLMVMNFVLWFTQTTFLMFASYILPLQYNWSSFYVGLVYVLGFIVVAFFLILMYFLRETLKRKDLYAVVIGTALIQISLGLLIYESVPKNVGDKAIVFLACGVLMFGSIPCTLISFKMLVTSVVKPGIQGTLQGLTSSIVRLAVIMGLFLSIVMVHERQIYESVMTAICFLMLIAFSLGTDRIRIRQREAREGGHKLL